MSLIFVEITRVSFFLIKKIAIIFDRYLAANNDGLATYPFFLFLQSTLGCIFGIQFQLGLIPGRLSHIQSVTLKLFSTTCGDPYWYPGTIGPSLQPSATVTFTRLSSTTQENTSSQFVDVCSLLIPKDLQLNDPTLSLCTPELLRSSTVKQSFVNESHWLILRASLIISLARAAVKVIDTSII